MAFFIFFVGFLLTVLVYALALTKDSIRLIIPSLVILISSLILGTIVYQNNLPKCKEGYELVKTLKHSDYFCAQGYYIES